VLFDFVMLTRDYGIDPKAVHQAFLAIDDYREAVNNHRCDPGMRGCARPLAGGNLGLALT
jgi:hypothetical protein